MSNLAPKIIKIIENFVNLLDLNSNNWFSGVVWDSLVHALLEASDFEDFDANNLRAYLEKAVNKKGFVGFSDNDSVTVKSKIRSEIIRLLQSHPSTYTMYVELVSFLPFDGYNIKISSDINIFTGRSPYLNVESPENDGVAVWLAVKGVGYLPPYGRSSALDSVESKIKQFLYFISKDSRFTYGYPDRVARQYWRDSEDEVVNAKMVDENLISYLGTPMLTIESLSPSSGLPKFDLRHDKGRSSFFMQNWEDYTKFFESEDASFRSQLGAAMEWFVDSIMDRNETLAYLKACIGLESVLGDPDKHITELSDRLTDRYAYMIGKNRSERISLAQTFKKILNLRGELVHARKRSLKSSQRELLKAARLALRECIEHELKAGA